jgi:hypothetical protein
VRAIDVIPTKLSNLSFFIVPSQQLRFRAKRLRPPQPIGFSLPTKIEKTGEMCEISNIQIIVLLQFEFSLLLAMLDYYFCLHMIGSR